MSGGGGTTVQSQDPWSGVQPYLKNLYQRSNSFFERGGPEYFPGETFVRPGEEQFAPWDYGSQYMSSVFGIPMNLGGWTGPGNYAQQPTGSTLYGAYGPGEDWLFQDLPPYMQPPGGGLPNNPDPYAPIMPGGNNPAYGDPDGPQDISPPTWGFPNQREYWDYDGPGGPVQPGMKAMPTDMMGIKGGTAFNNAAPGFMGTLNYSDLVGANTNMLTGQTPTGSMLGGVSPLAMQNLYGMSGWNPGSVGADPRGAINEMMYGGPNYDMVQEAVRAGAQPTLDILQEDILPGLRTNTNALNNPTGEIKDTNRIVPRVMRDITNAGTQAALGEYNRSMGARERGAGLASQLGLGYGNLGSSFALGTGNLGAGLAGQYSSDIFGGMQGFGDTLGTGLMPMDYLQGYGDFTQGYENLALQDAMNRFNYNQGRPYENANWYSGVLSGAGGLGGTSTAKQGTDWGAVAGNALMAYLMYQSDRRLKRNIRYLGTYKGNRWYTYDYLDGSPSFGVMADEVDPAFVVRINGYDAVNYAALMEA